MKTVRIFVVIGLIILLAGILINKPLSSHSSDENLSLTANGEGEKDKEKNFVSQLSKNGIFSHFAFITGQSTSIDGKEVHVNFEIFDSIEAGGRWFRLSKKYNLLDDSLQKEYFKYHVKAYPHKYDFMRINALNGGSLEYWFKDSKGTELMKIVMSNNELRDLFNSSTTQQEAKEKLLEILASEASSLLKGEKDNHCMITRIYYDGNSFITEYSVDERYIDMDLFKQNKNEIQKNMCIENLRAYNAETQGFIDDVLKEFKKGYLFRFKGNRSGKKVDIIVK